MSQYWCHVCPVNKPDAASGPSTVPTATAPPGAGGGPGSKYVPPNQRGGENRRGEVMSGSRSNRDGEYVGVVTRVGVTVCMCACMCR